MPDEWIPVPPNHETQVGDHYRITFHVRSNYDANTINKIVNALKYGAGMIDASPFTKMTGLWTIQDCVAQDTKGGDYVPLNHGQFIDWNLVVSATRYGAGTPLLAVIGPILAVLVVLGGVILVLGWTAEKLNKGPVGIALPILGVLGIGIVGLMFMKGVKAT